MVLQNAPDNADAIVGMARVYLTAGEPEQAEAVLATLPDPKPKSEDYTSLVAALKLASEAADLSEIAELQQTVEKSPDNLQARYDLALALNSDGKRVEAAEQLVTLMRRDRSWNDDGARKKLLEFFEAWGMKDPATLKGRRLLSSLLFS
jgi:putative thioredoxin